MFQFGCFFNWALLENKPTHFIVSILCIQNTHIYTTVQRCLVGKILWIFWMKSLCSPRLHWFDQNAAETVILWNIIQFKTTVFPSNLFQNVIYSCNEFSAVITSIFSVTWSFRYHSNILIWCSRNVYFLLSMLMIYSFSFGKSNIFL